MSLRDLELTPALQRLLVEAGLTTIELVLEHENRLPAIPGMTAKRLATVLDAIRWQRVARQDLERRRFIADRKAQAARIDKIKAYLDGFVSGAVPCSMKEIQETCAEAQRYARIMADERHPENVAAWIQHKDEE